MKARLRPLAATALAVLLLACARAPSTPTPTPKTPSNIPNDPSPPVDDAALASIRKDPLLAAMQWQGHRMLGVDVFVSTVLVGESAETMRIAARRHHEESGLFPILTPFANVPETAEEWADYEAPRDDVPEPFVLSQFVFDRDRSKLLGSLPHGKRLKAELPTATPRTDYHEGREYLATFEGPPSEKLALWLVRARPGEAAVVLADTGVEMVPGPLELAGMLERWRADWGAEPAYVDGRYFLEMTTTKRPADDASLRAFAWEFFLTCPSDREAFDDESAARLLGRLKDDRWVCWWFVE